LDELGYSFFDPNIQNHFQIPKMKNLYKQLQNNISQSFKKINVPTV